MKTYLGDESEGWNEITMSALACLSSLDSREAVVSAFLAFDLVSSKDLKGEWFPCFIEDVRKKAELGEPLIHPWTKKRYWVCFE